MMNDMIKLGVTLMIVTVVASLALALTNHYTAPQIEVQIDAALKESLNKVIDANSFQKNGEFYDAYKDETLVGRVATFEVSGYASIIKALVGMDPVGVITGIDVISHQETPGLGANIENEDFQKQFIGKKMKDLKINKDGGSIDAITGATISSRAITAGIKTVMGGTYDTVTSATQAAGDDHEEEDEEHDDDEHEEDEDEDDDEHEEEITNEGMYNETK